LTFVVAILTVGTRFTISPAQTGLVLSYILSVQQAYVPFVIGSFSTHITYLLFILFKIWLDRSTKRRRREQYEFSRARGILCDRR